MDMLNKLLIMAFIGGISLSVYGEENKITADYLIGKWECSLTDYGRKFYENGKIDFIEGYSDAVEYIRTRTYTFVKENGALKRSYYHSELNRTLVADLSDCSNLSHCVDIGGYIQDYATIASSTIITYISNNKFKIGLREVSRHPITRQLSSEFNSEYVCTRIK